MAAARKMTRMAAGKLVLPIIIGARKAKKAIRPKPVLAREIHASVVKSLRFGVNKVPGQKAVNSLALDMISFYAREAGIKHLHMPRIKRLVQIEMNPKISVRSKNRKFHLFIGKRKILEEIAVMEEKAMEQAENNRLAENYRETVLDKALPMQAVGSDGKKHPVSKQFVAKLVERAAQKAAIVLGDMNASLMLQTKK